MSARAVTSEIGSVNDDTNAPRTAVSSFWVIRRWAPVGAVASVLVAGCGGSGGSETVNGCAIEAGTSCPGADLSGAALSGSDLSRADLTGANLDGADLSKSDLSEANLSNAQMNGTNLSDADLTSANLTGATFDAPAMVMGGTGGKVALKQGGWAIDSTFGGDGVPDDILQLGAYQVYVLLIPELTDGFSFSATQADIEFIGNVDALPDGAVLDWWFASPPEGAVTLEVLDAAGIHVSAGEPGSAGLPWVAWDRDGYLVAWTGSGGLRAARVRPSDGALLGPGPISIAAGSSTLATNGSGLLAVWEAEETGPCYPRGGCSLVPVVRGAWWSDTRSLSSMPATFTTAPLGALPTEPGPKWTGAQGGIMRDLTQPFDVLVIDDRATRLSGSSENGTGSPEGIAGAAGHR